MKKIFIVISLLISTLAQAEWKIQKAGFLASSFTKIGSGRVAEIEPGDGPFPSNYWDASAIRNRMEFKGKIIIKEYNEETLSKRETVIDNVYMIMKAYGLILRAGVVKDAYFPFKGLKGKKISSIFDSTFHGGKIALGIGFLIGVYPNYSFLMNGYGVRIPNIERMFRFDMNIGIEIGYLSMDFNTQSLNSKGTRTIVRSQGEGEKKTSVKKVPVKELLERTLGN